ncbi:hypothetical protein AVEN_21699-1 [Araneus ventricosus]|uniref:Uncharacterized protein n=1 Tax=Araneus ventricosus TaxID=182803 RepID=A0A4Y2JMH2_ARAVE|nr:hypothetical protein AVEN_21699-1 [Araneus ventricosus]
MLTTIQKEFPVSRGGYWLINITIRWWHCGALQEQPPACLILFEYQGSDNCAACICADCYLPFVCAQARAGIVLRSASQTLNLGELGVEIEMLPSVGCRRKWNFWCCHLVVGLKVCVACSSGLSLWQYED